MALQPQATKAVLDHVVNDPVRREKLGGRRDILLGDLDVFLQVGKDFVLRLGVVILIQPANDLHLIGPVFLRDGADHLLNHATLAEQVIRQQQFSVVLNSLEQHRQDAVQSIALHDQQVLE